MGLKSKLQAFARNRSNSPRRSTKFLPSSSKNPNVDSLSSSPPRIRSAYQERKEFSKNGSLNFRMLAFAGGISVILTSTLSIGICIAHFEPLAMIVYIYTFMVGILICILEGQFLKSEIMNHIREGAIEGLPILKYLWGRGVLYSLSGSLQLSHLSSMNMLSGAFLVAVGVLFILVGIHTRRRLNKLKKSVKDVKVLMRHFRRFDRDNDGVLDMDEFGNLVAHLTKEDMDEDELEGVFSSITKSDEGHITLEELQAWFSGFKEEVENEESGGKVNAFQTRNHVEGVVMSGFYKRTSDGPTLQIV